MSWLKERILNWFQSLILRIIEFREMPKHVAFIMDGNRRYKKTEGHSKGLNKMINALNWCTYLGIVEVTVYIFSIENFKRSKEEVDNLMDLIRQNFKDLLKDKKKLKDDKICFRVIGNLSLIPEDICKLKAEVIIITRENNRMFVNYAIAYTSRDEITHAIKDVSNTCIYFTKVLWPEFSPWNFFCAIFYYPGDVILAYRKIETI
ncbi:Dehydrodolichyl diphosphate synthase [Trachymyrmex septentrionalis]|uniref:Alkyl transferase n=1 Tax=Trachymyrmex septentrionalis TaxID=34720 RepID=A0A195EUA6_9HYME|nr:Dehydrodolichyl diphosphate synthase [Trachymyrmex septentrionalis]